MFAQCTVRREVEAAGSFIMEHCLKAFANTIVFKNNFVRATLAADKVNTLQAINWRAGRR